MLCSRSTAAWLPLRSPRSRAPHQRLLSCHRQCLHLLLNKRASQLATGCQVAIGNPPFLPKMKTRVRKANMHTWRCPLCTEDDPITRGSQEFLDMAVAAHILSHESRAVLRGVDRARISCPFAQCEIGRSNHINKSTGSVELPLTEFDKTLLGAMKVAGE